MAGEGEKLCQLDSCSALHSNTKAVLASYSSTSSPECTGVSATPYCTSDVLRCVAHVAWV